MIKKLFLVLPLFLFFSLLTFAQTDEVSDLVGTYNGQSEKAYYFTDTESGQVVEFKFISKESLSRVDLSNRDFIGKKFKIKYFIDYDASNVANSFIKRLSIITIEVVKE